MKRSIPLIFLFFSLVSFSQKKECSLSATEILRKAPDSVFISVPSLSTFLKANFHSEEDLLCAVYVWMAGNIDYDVEKMYLIRYEEKPEEMADNAFYSKKAICQGYSALFNDLCRRCGIQSYVVNGYTRQNGEVSSLGHAWVVAKLDEGWFCFDPTWGAGYIENRTYHRHLAPEYFMVSPGEFINTHMPLDPMWQLLEHPHTIPEFYAGAGNGDEAGHPYEFGDSICDYMRMNPVGQAEVTLRRLKEAGIYNNVIRDYARYLAQIIENDEIRKRNEYQKLQVDRMNLAVDYYNKAVKQFNDYINYFNRQFKPVKTDEEIRGMIADCDRELLQAQQYLENTDPFNAEMTQNLEQLENTLTALKQNVYDQEKFVRRYLSTPKQERAKLFRQN